MLDVVENIEKPLKKFPYQLPESFINDGVTYLETHDGPIPLEVFGEHNLLNLEGAKAICKQLGVMEDDFYEAIQSFKGASKRLELINRTNDFVAYKDFAHAPSKVTSVTQAVKNQYENKEVVACLEIHTYSSLNAEFLSQYNGALDKADTKIVFYDPEALKIKRMQMISPEDIKESFGDESILVFTTSDELKTYLENLDKKNKVFLMMSSGSFGGIDLKELLS